MSIICRKRLTASQCLQNKWMMSDHEKKMETILSTDKLKKFIIRRKWQVRNLTTTKLTLNCG